MKTIIISGFDGLGKTTLRRVMANRLEEMGMKVFSRSTSDAIAEDLEPLFGSVVWERPMTPMLREMFCVYANCQRSIKDTYFMERNKPPVDSDFDVAIIDGVRFPRELEYFEPDWHIHLKRPTTTPMPIHAVDYWHFEGPLKLEADVVLEPFPTPRQVQALAETLFSDVL